MSASNSSESILPALQSEVHVARWGSLLCRLLAIALSAFIMVNASANLKSGGIYLLLASLILDLSFMIRGKVVNQQITEVLKNSASSSTILLNPSPSQIINQSFAQLFPSLLSPAWWLFYASLAVGIFTLPKTAQRSELAPFPGRPMPTQNANGSFMQPNGPQNGMNPAFRANPMNQGRPVGAPTGAPPFSTQGNPNFPVQGRPLPPHQSGSTPPVTGSSNRPTENLPKNISPPPIPPVTSLPKTEAKKE